MPDLRPILELRAISKRFGGVQALDNVDLSICAGEIVAIVGENGAGKSTLLKILAGIVQPDNGQIYADGQLRHLHTVRDADAVGVRSIHQELNLAEDLSIAENVFLGRQPYRGPRWLSVVDARSMYRQATDILHKVGLQISPRVPVRRLSIAQRQLVEIAKALSTDGSLIVFDEPTSSLSLEDANRLLTLIEKLRERGVAIIYVSHRLQEVERLADRVLVLRDGKHVGTLTGAEIDRQQMISLMIGRDLQQLYHKINHTVLDGPPALEVRDLRFPGAATPASFGICHGEIVGFAGLVGAGRTELANAVFGIAPAYAGKIYVEGRPVRIGSPTDALAAGIALVPEDRKACGLLLQLPIDVNVTLAALPRLARFGRYNRSAAGALAREFQEKLDIVTPDLRRRAATLSGGNQQKVVLAKWLAREPRVLILDEPTRGVDVGAKSDIYRYIFALAAQGMAVMIISSELEEIIGVSDRVIVMHEGRIAGQLANGQISEASIMQLAVGQASLAQAS
jgi:ribose transport system ATP-binding protein